MPGLSPSPLPCMCLAWAWLRLGVVALLLASGFSAILVAFRTPFLAGWLPGGGWFRVALILHVDLAVMVWFLAMAVALWSLIGGERWQRVAWLGWWLSAGGMALMVVSPLCGAEQPVMSNYLPVLRHPVFLTGLLGFGMGVGLSLLRTLLARSAPTNGWLGESGVRAAAITAAIAFLEVIRVGCTLPLELADPAFFEALFWGGGHLLQLTHTLLMSVAWLWLAEADGWRPGPKEARWIRVIHGLGWLPAALVPYGWFLGSPMGLAYRDFYSSWMAWGSWPTAVVIGLAICFRAGRASSILATTRRFSMLLFGVGLLVGGFIAQDNLVVTAHYHGTVGAVTLAYMGLVGMLLRQWRGQGPARGSRLETMMAAWQPWLYGLGLLTMIVGLLWSGWLGAPRKTTLVDSYLQAGGIQPTDLLASLREAGGLWLLGGGGLIAMVATLLFLVMTWRGIRLVAGNGPFGWQAGGVHADGI